MVLQEERASVLALLAASAWASALVWASAGLLRHWLWFGPFALALAWASAWPHGFGAGIPALARRRSLAGPEGGLTTKNRRFDSFFNRFGLR